MFTVSYKASFRLSIELKSLKFAENAGNSAYLWQYVTLSPFDSTPR